MSIEYQHTANRHTLDGALAALPLIFADFRPKSLLDVGCGTGTWVRAAKEYGIADVKGVDGVELPQERLLFPKRDFQKQDLTSSWRLGRRFDVVLCLEVAEHLEERYSATLIEALVAHADRVVFSAACPDQFGQHHVNGQWPEYWQRIFNAQGYVCNDAVRWRIWDEAKIEPWYRQNLFIAHREPETAGKERRIASVVHPEMLANHAFGSFGRAAQSMLREVEHGSRSLGWYLTTPFKAVAAKLRRRCQSGESDGASKNVR